MVQGIHHFAIIASSEESVRFYTKLGFRETYRRERKYDTVVLLEGYGIQIEMFVDPNHPDRATNPENTVRAYPTEWCAPATPHAAPRWKRR